MRTSRALRAVVALGAVVAGFSVVTGAPPAGAATGLPPGFVDLPVASVSSPTSLTPLADGRVLVTSQTGQVGAIPVPPTGSVTPISVAAFAVCSTSERGLLGAAVDPANTSSVFLYYTADLGGGTCRNRIARYTLSGNSLINPVVVFDNIPSQAGNHNGGDIHFGKDGFLYAGIGDSGCDPRGDSGCQDANNAARDLSLPNGKILRMTSNGDPAPGNPFLNAAGSVACKAGPAAPGQICREIFAYGVRNPFRLGFDPNAASTRFFINDVGGSAWEEIDQGAIGGDYGWNVREGPCVVGSTTNCGPPTPPIINPIYAYSHVASGCSTLTGGAFVPNGAWPGYDGTYMYAEFSCGKIYTLSDDCGSWTPTTFAAGLGGVTDLEFVGNELWYGSYDGVVHRIVPPPSPVGGTPSRFVPLTPTRKLDTRNAIGGPTGVVPAGGTRTVSLAPEVPAGAVAAVVNVTITGALAPGFVTAWPADKPRPGTSTLNVVQAGQTVPNTALLALSPSQTINVFTQSGGHLIVDVYGYYVPSGATSAGRFTSLAPQRILDTRTGNGAPVGRVNGQVDLQVTGRGGVPGSGVAAVAMVLTGTDALGPGFATAWPTGQPLPNASTLNLSSPNETRANLVVVPVGANGKVSLRTSMGVHLIADVAGWITDASQPSSASRAVRAHHPDAPARYPPDRSGAPGHAPRGHVHRRHALGSAGGHGSGGRQPHGRQRAGLRVPDGVPGRRHAPELVEPQHEPAGRRRRWAVHHQARSERDGRLPGECPVPPHHRRHGLVHGLTGPAWRSKPLHQAAREAPATSRSEARASAATPMPSHRRVAIKHVRRSGAPSRCGLGG